MAKKSRLDKILEERKKQQKANTTGNTRTISTGLPSTRQNIVMPQSTSQNVQQLAQSLFNRTTNTSTNLTTQQQNRLNSVVANYQPIKNNGLAPKQEDKNKEIVKKAVENYNPNFRNEKNLSKEGIKYNPEAKQLTTWNKVQQTANKNAQENQDKKWYQKFVQESGALKDGYQFGDLSQATGATALEGVLQVVKPFSDLGTGLANIGATGVAQVADWIGKDEFANRLRKAIGANESVVDTGIKLANQDSVLGDTTDTILNAFGQYGLNAIGGQALGKAGQMKILGVNAPTLSVISSFGQGLKKGYSDKDYKNWQVYLKASGDAVIEGMTEGINDVLGVGGSTLSDMLKGSAMKPFKSGLAKALARTGLSSAEEGLEEVLSYLGSLGLDNLIGYLEVSLNQGDGEKWKREFDKDEFWENFWVGTISALVTEAPNTAMAHNAITQKAIQDKTNELGRELTKNEQQQISKDAILNHETNIQKDYTKGNEITKQIKNSGLTENQQQKLTEVAEKYDLSQADIQNLIDNTKNGKYTEKQGATIENKPISEQGQQTIQTEGKVDEKAISQQVEQELKNTNYKREESVKRAFESAKKYNIDTKSDTFKEKIRIADERGVDLVYDASVFGNNTNQNAVWKIKRDENGKIVSREIVFNPNAKGNMTLEQVWTHEITHDMEGNGKYKTMRNELLEYLQAKPEYEKAFNDLKAIYAKVYAEENLTEQEFNELIEDEVVADMLGSKLGDTEFLKSLNKEKRSLGKRIYDWVVDRLNRLNKKKGYTNEKLFWQDIKNKFENAYKEDFADSSILTKYSVERDNKGLEGTSSFNLQKNKDGTLLALHNLSADKLKGVLELGGFPVPSIAVTNPNKVNHESYGAISVIFNKNAIDPADERNEVYDRDVWSPTFPTVEYEINDDIISEVRKIVGGHQNSYQNGANSTLNNLEDRINRIGFEKALEELKKDTDFKYVYAKTLNDTLEPIFKDVEENIHRDFSNETIKEFIEEYGKVPKWTEISSEDRNILIENFKNKVVPELEKRVEEKRKKLYEENPNPPMFKLRILESSVENAINKLDALGYQDNLIEAMNKIQEGNTTVRHFDKVATDTLVNEIIKDANYEEWIDTTFKDIILSKGIYNDKEYLKPDGTRRTFKQLHDNYNLSNIVKYMTSKATKSGQVGFGSGSSFGSISAQKANRFNSIEDIKNAENRLTSEEKELIKPYEELIYADMKELAKYIKHKSDYVLDSEIVGPALNDLASKEKLTDSVIKKVFDENNIDYKKVPKALINKITNDLESLRNVPTDYFEAKPQRAVGFEEIASMVIPNDLDANLKKQLQDRGIKTIEYDPNVEGDRNAKMTSAELEEYKFSLSQETKANLEAKIDRYSKLVEEMQQDGRDAEDWAPYANEILRLQDQLDGNRFSRESTGAWNEFKNKYAKNEGEGKTIQDITLQPKKISEVFKKNVLLDNTIKSKKYTGKKQTNNEIAKILDTPKERQKPEDRKWAIFKANILDKGIVFEDLSKKAKNRELEAKWDYTLSSGARGQYAIGNARYEYVDGKKTKVAKGLTEIIDEVGDKVSDFQNYMYHQLNVDRMSLEKNAKAEMERMKANELFNYDDVVIRNLARKRITDKLTPERKQLILDAKQYVALSEVQNKPVFGKGVTEFHSKNKVAEFEKNNPEFKKWAKDVYDYLKADKMELVKNGVISEELSSKFEQLYPHYVPIQRVDKNGNAISVPLDTRRTGINTPIKEAKGGNSDIGPLFQTMANRTMQTYRASARNSLGLELRKTLQQLNNYNGTDTKADLDNIIESMENESENNTLLQASSNGRLPTFTVFENGNKVTFDISEDVYDALKPKDSSSLTSKTSKILNTIGNLRRGLLTEYNPLFSVTNTIKDAQDVLANSQHALKTYLKFPEAYQQILQKGYWYKEYMQNGGEQNSYFKEGDFVKEEKSKIKSLVTLPLEKISQINNVMEMAPRLAEYIASRESGRSIQTSMLDASRVTTNFKAGGDVTKFLNRNGATFLNAGVQGTMQVVRNFREANMQGAKGYAILASKLAVMGLPVLILNNLIWDDDEEYDELQDYVKDSYYIVGKTKDGNFIRIPKGRFVASVQKIVSNVNDYLNNKKELNIDNVSKDLWESLGFAFENMAPNNPIENNVASPIFQVASNTSWYGEDIVPERLQSVPKAEQYDETTDAFSIWLGDKLNVSPMKINYLLDQYGGGVADILLPMGTKQAENNVIEDKFTTNPTMKSKYPGEFFEKSDEIEVQSNSMNATDEDIVKNKYMSDISGEMSKLYKEKRKIQNSDATDESKKEQLEKVQEQINEFAKTGIEEVDKAKVNQYIAEVGDKAYYKDDEGKWKEIDKEKDLAEGLSLKTYADYKNKVAIATDKKRIEKNNDKATLSDSEKSQILLDSNYSEKEKRLMYPKYIGNEDKTYEYLSKITGDKVSIDQYLDYKTQADELKADDDPKSNIKGKTVSGSKKKKVVNYLNNSDFTAVERLYIYGTQYSFDSKQKTQFTNYIDTAKKQGKITSSEAKEIYKKLNSVQELEDGRIRWK